MDDLVSDLMSDPEFIESTGGRLDRARETCAVTIPYMDYPDATLGEMASKSKGLPVYAAIGWLQHCRNHFSPEIRLRLCKRIARDHRAAAKTLRRIPDLTVPEQEVLRGDL